MDGANSFVVSLPDDAPSALTRTGHFRLSDFFTLHSLSKVALGKKPNGDPDERSSQRAHWMATYRGARDIRPTTL